MRSIVVIISILLIGCSGVQFQPIALYDQFEEPPKKEFTKAVIFDEGVGTMWNSLFDCGQFEVSKEDAYSGNSSIKISWNKGTCEWIGFGNSWNNWIPTDLTTARHELALSFYARTQEKTARAIPIVAALEDFGGGGSYHFIDAGKYLRGLELDSSWKQIIVPLWDFPIFEEEVDISSIKQIQFQLEGAGAYFLDQMEIIPYSTEEYTKHRAEVELLRPKGNPNQEVYTEGDFYEDAWGFTNNPCQELEEIKDNQGNTHIKWSFTTPDCTWAKWGINWNGWYASNLRGVTELSAITCKIKCTDKAKFKMMIQDFNGHSADILTEASLENIGEWQTVTVPLASLNLKDKGFKLDRIQQISFEGKNSGTVFIDDISITQLDNMKKMN